MKMNSSILIIIIIAIITFSAGAIVVWTEYGSVCNKSVTDHLQKYSNLFDDNFVGILAIEGISLPFGVNESSIQ